MTIPNLRLKIMYIKNLKIKNFRNYDDADIEFSPKTNILCGNNGQGKTNIIEALYYLQSGKSFRCRKDRETIMFGKKNALIEIDFVIKGNDEKVQFYLSDKKSIKLNGIPIERLSELVGIFNMVIFTPDHLNLIKDGPGIRRSFIDSLISQLKPSYLMTLINYYHVLKVRNAALKSTKADLKSNISIWDMNLADYGTEIFKMRNSVIKKINGVINNINYDNEIFEREKIKLKYIPAIRGDFEDKKNFFNQLSMNIEKDREKGMTLTGPHRDDFEIFMNGIDMKKYGSQGQIRSCVLKLKLSECEIIKEKVGEEPVLLLDDVLSELDKNRRKFFLDKLKKRQIIITCTDNENIEDKESIVYEIENAQIKKVKLEW